MEQKDVSEFGQGTSESEADERYMYYEDAFTAERFSLLNEKP